MQPSSLQGMPVMQIAFSLGWLGKQAMEAQKGRAGRVWQECPSVSHSKCRSPVLSLGAELYWLQGLQEHGGQVCRLWYFCCRYVGDLLRRLEVTTSELAHL